MGGTKTRSLNEEMVQMFYAFGKKGKEARFTVNPVRLAHSEHGPQSNHRGHRSLPLTVVMIFEAIKTLEFIQRMFLLEQRTPSPHKIITSHGSCKPVCYPPTYVKSKAVLFILFPQGSAYHRLHSYHPKELQIPHRVNSGACFVTSLNSLPNYFHPRNRNL